MASSPEMLSGHRRSGVVLPFASAAAVSGEELERVVGASQDGIVIVQNRHVIHANPTALKALGAAAPEDVRAMPLARLFAPEDRQRLALADRLLLVGGGPIGPLPLQQQRLDRQRRLVDVVLTRIDWRGFPAVLVMMVPRADGKRAEPAREGEWIVQVMESQPDGVIVHQDGQIVYLNPAAATQLASPDSAALVGRLFHELVVSADRTATRDRHRGLYRSPAARTRGFLRLLRQDGEIADFEEISVAARWNNRAAVITSLRSATDRQQMLMALKASEARNYQLIEHSKDAILAYAERRIVLANEAAVRLLGASSRDDLIGRSPLEFCVPDNLVAATRRIEAVEKQQAAPHTTSAKWVRLDGLWIDVEWTSVPFDYEGRPAAYNLIRDIGPRLRAEAESRYVASHDALTGLPNRIGFQAYLQKALSRARRQRSRVALYFLDLDNFKGVNDSLGHQVGDRLLVIVADRLRATVDSSALVARFGGDEFAIVQVEADDTSGVVDLAGQIREAVAAVCDLVDHRLYPTATLGIAFYPDHAKTAEDLLRKADMALYRAKDSGRNSVGFYTEDLNRQVQERERLLSDMGEAVRRQEFTLHFQPIAALVDGRIQGLEALIRWNHPTRGLLPAGLFIDALESSPHAGVLGERLLRLACEKGQKLRQSGLPPMRIAVNLSMNQLRRPDLVDVVAKVLADTGFAAELLELELTENVIMNAGVAEVAETFQRLAKLGVQIALDDFGTGYSSLTFLKRFPVSRIKIDQSFVAGSSTNPEDTEIVRALIKLGHALKLEVTAEGVETRDEIEFLRSEGCDEMQGYYLAEPMDADAVSRFIRDRRG